MASKPMTYDVSDPLSFLLSVMHDDTLPLDQRMQAAIEAAPYVHSTCRIVRNADRDAQLPAMTSMPPPAKPKH